MLLILILDVAVEEDQSPREVSAMMLAMLARRYFNFEIAREDISIRAVIVPTTIQM